MGLQESMRGALGLCKALKIHVNRTCHARVNGPVREDPGSEPGLKLHCTSVKIRELVQRWLKDLANSSMYKVGF